MFVAFYYVDGVLRERQYEVLCYAVGAAVIMLYVIVNYAVKKGEGQPIRLVGVTSCAAQILCHTVFVSISCSGTAGAGVRGSTH